jgi:hypothetical protein
MKSALTPISKNFPRIREGQNAQKMRPAVKLLFASQ